MRKYHAKYRNNRETTRSAISASTLPSLSNGLLTSTRDLHTFLHPVHITCPYYFSLPRLITVVICSSPNRFLKSVVDLPLLRVAVEGPDNPIIQSSPARRPFHMASRGTTLSGDIQRSSMLLRWSVVCWCVLQRGKRGEG